MLHDASPILEIFHGLHLLGHSQNLVEAGAESRHVLEVGLLLHLHRQVVHPCVLQDGRHLEVDTSHVRNTQEATPGSTWPSSAQRLRLQTQQNHKRDENYELGPAGRSLPLAVVLPAG